MASSPLLRALTCTVSLALGACVPDPSQEPVKLPPKTQDDEEKDSEKNAKKAKSAGSGDEATKERGPAADSQADQAPSAADPGSRLSPDGVPRLPGRPKGAEDLPSGPGEPAAPGTEQQ